MARVLIVEDDEIISQSMVRHLAAAGFETSSASKGDDGLARLRHDDPDVCVLDLMLPNMDGWSVIEAARREGISTPIVVISARGSTHDRVHALDIGADDYLVKPFSMEELIARVRAALRRGGGSSQHAEKADKEFVIEELRVDPANVQAWVDGESADLTATEFRLLYTLAAQNGRVITREDLMLTVWGRRLTHRDRTVDVYIGRLRDKIDQKASSHTFVQTRYGVGYKLEAVAK